MNNLTAALLAVNKTTTISPEGVGFDGVTDYISRATDFTGNIDSKTFTFSDFEYHTTAQLQYIYDDGGKFQISINASNQLVILGKNAAGTTILNATVTSPLMSLNTFNGFEVSIDMANTANRKIYINEVAATVTWTTYTNDTIDFTNTTHTIGALNAGTSKLKGRLSNVFLAYEYVDLSIESNRRIFITADGKPA